MYVTKVEDNSGPIIFSSWNSDWSVTTTTTDPVDIQPVAVETGGSSDSTGSGFYNATTTGATGVLSVVTTATSTADVADGDSIFVGAASGSIDAMLVGSTMALVMLGAVAVYLL
jgi:hypothetical protein